MTAPRYPNRDKLPRIVGGKLSDDEGEWMLERLARPRLRGSPGFIAGLRGGPTFVGGLRGNGKPKAHPLLERPLRFKRLLCVEKLADGRDHAQYRWLWLVKDVEAVEQIRGAYERRQFDARIAAAEGRVEDVAHDNAWWTAKEVEEQCGWHRTVTAEYAKSCGLLGGKPIKSRREWRPVGRRMVNVRVFSARDCVNARAAQASGTAAGIIRVIDAARTLGMPPETLYKWEHVRCPALGRVIPMSRSHGRDTGNRSRRTVFMTLGDFDELRRALEAATANALPYNVGARRYDIPISVLRDSTRRIHRAIGRLVEPVKVFAPTEDQSRSRRRRHTRRRLLDAIPIPILEEFARWYTARDGKPRDVADRGPIETEPKKRRRGRKKGKTTYNVADDAKVAAEWESLRSRYTSMDDFARAKGYDAKAVARAIDRNRHRKPAG